MEIALQSAGSNNDPVRRCRLEPHVDPKWHFRIKAFALLAGDGVKHFEGAACCSQVIKNSYEVWKMLMVPLAAAPIVPTSFAYPSARAPHKAHASRQGCDDSAMILFAAAKANRPHFAESCLRRGKTDWRESLGPS